MAFSDILSRQFYEAYMNSDSSLSVEWAQVPSPLQNLHGIRLKNAQLCPFLLKTPSEEPTYDIWAKSIKYRQRIHLEEVNNMLSVAPMDLAFSIGLEALHNKWNDPKLMSIPIWEELAQTNKLSFTSSQSTLPNNTV